MKIRAKERLTLPLLPPVRGMPKPLPNPVPQLKPPSSLVVPTLEGAICNPMARMCQAFGLLSAAQPPSSVQVEDSQRGQGLLQTCCRQGPLYSSGQSGLQGTWAGAATAVAPMLAAMAHLLAGRADNALLLLRLVVAAGAAAALPDDALAHAV